VVDGDSAGGWVGASMDARFAGDETPFRLGSKNGLELSKGSSFVEGGSTMLSSPATLLGSGVGVDFFSSFAESAFDKFSFLPPVSAEGIGTRSFASVCAVGGGAGTALRAGARLGTGGAPCGAGEPALEGARSTGEPALDRLGARGEPGRCNICEGMREGNGAGEATRSRGRGGGDAGGNAGEVGVSGRGTV
jgi:hypothetical protein